MKFLGTPGHYQARRRTRPSKNWPRIAAAASLAGAVAAALLVERSPAPEPATASVELTLPQPASTTPTTPTAAPADAALPFEPLTSKQIAAVPANVPTPPVAAPPAAAAPVEDDWLSVTVAPGDNLSLIFSRLKLSKSDLHTIVQLDRDKARLRRLRPGQLLRVRADESRIESLVLELDELNSFRVERTADGSFALSTETVEPEVREASTAAVITRSLFLDAQQAGLDDATIMRLTDIFGWDIDFALDIREGDRFSAIYEEIYKDGEMIKQGRILAAEFINRGRRLRAVWFTNESGESAYYSDEGHAMRKAFLRTPVNFTRISSRFNLRRKHPVLNTIRAHRGVDYAAPLGTPVRSTANGKIRSVGRNGGYGRVVEIQHGKSYRTLYAHLSRFAKGLKRGSSVRQGQVIGYVGKSGLATGPHLHYEFRVNGHHRNPLTVDLPKAQPIDGRYLDEFKRHAQPFLQRLAVLNDVTDETSPALVASLDAESLDGEARTPRQN